MFMHPNGTNGKKKKNMKNGKFNKSQLSIEHLAHAGSAGERERVWHFARISLSCTKCSIQYKNMVAGCHVERAALCCTVARPLPMCSPSCHSTSPQLGYTKNVRYTILSSAERSHKCFFLVQASMSLHPPVASCTPIDSSCTKRHNE